MTLLRNLTRNTRIGTRMALTIALPMLTVAVLATLLMRDLWLTETAMTDMRALSRFGMKIAELGRELQRERGLSAGFASSGGTQFAAELPAQIRTTDERIAALRASAAQLPVTSFPPGTSRAIETGLTALTTLNARRADIAARRLTADDILKLYGGVIGQLYDVPLEAVKSAADPAMTAALISFYSYISAEERAARERGTGAGGFAAGRFTPEAHRAFLSIVADQKAFFEAFESYATPDQRAFARQTVTAEATQALERLRRIAIEAGPDKPLGDITGPEWFKVATARMDLMRRVEERLGADLEEIASRTASDARRRLTVTALFVGLVSILTAILGTWLARGIVRPIRDLTTATHTIAEGDLSVEIDGHANKDELGTMARALVVLRDTARDRARLEAEVAAARKTNVDRQSAMEEYTSEFSRSISGVMEQMTAAAAAMTRAAVTVAGSVGETRQRAARTSDGANESSANLAAVAAAAEQMSASIGEISRQVAAVTQAADDAARKTVATDERVAGLAAAAEKIGDIVSLIAGIAGQTNLLALNATIEAARAGEAGKGFAVVAGEVKVLASRTAKATDEIGAQIAAIRRAAGDAVEAVRGAGDSVESMNRIAIAIAGAVEEQSSATRDIAASVQTVAVATRSAADAMHEVSELVANAEQAARDVSAAAAHVGDTAADLRRDMDCFVRAIENPDQRHRRAYERIPGNGLTLSLDRQGSPSGSLPVANVSRGGVALRCSITLPPGTEVTVRAQDGGHRIPARVARYQDGILALAFRQDDATVAIVDTLLARASANAGLAAAA